MGVEEEVGEEEGEEGVMHAGVEWVAEGEGGRGEVGR